MRPSNSFSTLKGISGMNSVFNKASSSPFFKQSSAMSNRFQSGFTLVEIMIALLLGLLLTAVMVQSYLSTKNTYNTTQSVSEVQENTRFVTHFLKQDIRRAGNFGCIDKLRNKLNPTEELNFAQPISGWDYNGTGLGDAEYTLSEAPVLETNLDEWSGISSQLPASFSGKVVKGSDVIILASMSQTNVVLRGINSTSAGALVSEEPHGFDQGQILIVGDCFLADVFQMSVNGNNEVSLVASQSSRISPGNSNLGSNKWGYRWGNDSTVSELTTSAYYIGIGSSGEPSLFRTSLSRGNGTVAPDLELVEGVESFQVLYGEDLNGNDNLRKPNRYVSADLVLDWANVVSVRFGLLMRSSEAGADEDQADSYRLLDVLDIKHQAEDRRLRYVVNSTVKPRNRGIARSYTVCLPDEDGCGNDRVRP